MITFNGLNPSDYNLEFVHGQIYERMFNHTRFQLVFRLSNTYLDEWLINKLSKIVSSSVEVTFPVGSGTNKYNGKILNFSSNKANANTEIEIAFTCVSETTFFDSLYASECFVEKSLSDIFKNCSGNIVDVRGDTNKYTVFKYNETGFNFIKRMAHEHGFWLFLKNDQWHCLRELPHSSVKELSGEIFRFGININHGSIKAETKVYNTMQNKIEADNKQASPSENTFWTHTLPAFDNKETTSSKIHLKLPVNNTNQKTCTAVIAERMAANLFFFNGESTHKGLNLGDVFKFTENYKDQFIKLSDDRNYGNYRILELSHFFTPDSYHNSFTSIPDDHKMTPSSFTTDFTKPRLPIIDGFVKEIGKGKHTGSVKVQYDGVSGISPFIRVLGYGAGANRGFYFLPELDDRVSVGFTDGHPDMPFIIGSHYNPKNMPAVDGNVLKRWKTISGLFISLNDDSEKNEIIIATKDGQNAVTLNYTDDEIVVEAQKGTVSVKGKNVIIKAEEAMKFEANTISLVAKSKMKITSAQMVINGDASTSISGGIVKINS